MASVECLFLETKQERAHLFHDENLLRAGTVRQEGGFLMLLLETNKCQLTLCSHPHNQRGQQHVQMDKTPQLLHLPHCQSEMCWIPLD